VRLPLLCSLRPNSPRCECVRDHLTDRVLEDLLFFIEYFERSLSFHFSFIRFTVLIHLTEVEVSTFRERSEQDLDQQFDEQLLSEHYLNEGICLTVGMLATDVGVQSIVAEFC
jgi:hypothetical protein